MPSPYNKRSAIENKRNESKNPPHHIKHRVKNCPGDGQCQNHASRVAENALPYSSEGKHKGCLYSGRQQTTQQKLHLKRLTINLAAEPEQ